jgi:hypothetical protein
MTVNLDTFRAGSVLAPGATTRARPVRVEAAVHPPLLSPLGALALIVSACGTVPLAVSASMARRGDTDVRPLWWLGVAMIVVPPVLRLCSRHPSRTERVLLVCALALFLFGTRLAFDPIRVPYHDELLHDFTARNIMRNHRLFDANSMLPASPVFPGLEIVTTAIANVTGLSVPVSGLLVIAIARLVTMLALFLLVEQAAGSHYAAGLACAVYAANPQYTLWNSYYAYESLAIPLLILSTYCLLRSDGPARLRWGIATTLVVGALVTTHHVTALLFLSFVFMWSVVTLTSRAFRRDRKVTWLITCVTGAFLVVWVATAGRTAWGYLYPIGRNAVVQLGDTLHGTGQHRQLFSDPTGEKNPLGERIAGVSSLLVLSISLVFAWWFVYRTRAGRLRSTLATCEPNTSAWKLLLETGRRPSAFAALAVLSLGYPASYVGRLLPSTSFLAARSASFVYFGAAAMIAVWLTVRLRQTGSAARVAVGAVIAFVVLGGIAFGAQPAYVRLPGEYLVAADARSVDTPALDAADWAGENLPSGARISADRVNRLLFGVAAGTHAITSLGDKVYVNWLYTSPDLGPFQQSLIDSANIEYLVSDLRLSTGLPKAGVYFEEGEQGDQLYTEPLPLAGMTKYRDLAGVNTIYDNGAILVFDIRRLDPTPG